jgi:hypothetical protein
MTLPEFRRAVAAQTARAAEAREEGNARFREGALQEAAARYVDALDLLAGALEVPALRRPDMADLLRRAHAAHAACHLNLAACALKVRAARAQSGGRAQPRARLRREPRAVAARRARDGCGALQRGGARGAA